MSIFNRKPKRPLWPTPLTEQELLTLRSIADNRQCEWTLENKKREDEAKAARLIRETQRAELVDAPTHIQRAASMRATNFDMCGERVNHDFYLELAKALICAVRDSKG